MAYLTSLAALPLNMSAQSASSRPIELVSLGMARGASLPPGWALRAVRGQRAPSSNIDDASDGRRWTVTSAGQAGWFTYDARQAPYAANAKVSATVRIVEAPLTADLSVEARNDAALRLFVVLQAGRGMFARRRVVMYSLGNVGDGPRVTRGRDGLCDIHVPAEAQREWTPLQFTPGDDAVRFCGWEPAPIVGVGFLHDSEQTGARTTVEIRSIRVDRGSDDPL